MGKVWITYAELKGRGVPFTRKHILWMMRHGQFPKSVQLSRQRVAWDAADIAEWLNSRPVARALEDKAA